MRAPTETAAPLALYRETVHPEWIDYNGHMNVAYYVLAFDHATDAFFDFLGLDEAYRTGNNCSTFAVESHVTYVRELHAGDPMRFATRLVGYDEKRLHYFHYMYHGEDGFLAATAEWLSLHVDMGTRRVTPMPRALLDRLAAVHAEHARLPLPPELGHVITVAPRMS